MRALPFDLRFKLGESAVHLVHGSPRKVNEYLFEDKPASLYERLAAAEERMCSCSVTPTSRGSTPMAGCCSSTAVRSVSRRTATRAPRSRSSSSTTAGRCSASIERVPYDAEAVAREVAAAGLPGEYAEKLVAAA